LLPLTLATAAGAFLARWAAEKGDEPALRRIGAMAGGAVALAPLGGGRQPLAVAFEAGHQGCVPWPLLSSALSSALSASPLCLLH